MLAAKPSKRSLKRRKTTEDSDDNFSQGSMAEEEVEEGLFITVIAAAARTDLKQTTSLLQMILKMSLQVVSESAQL